jgi:hypothetical protein
MSLTFASPWFLLGLLSIAIPIYLHLYHRKNPIRKEFPSLRLIRLSVEFIARRKKMKNLILLALRIMLLALIIAALSRPFIGQSASAGAASATPAAFVVLLDNSMSMGCTHQGISLFNTARSRALEILDQMKSGDKATVGLLNDPGNLLFSQLTWDRDSLKKSVANAPLSMAGTSVYSSLLPALKLLVPLKSYRRAVYVITDMTESAWKPFIERYNLEDVDPGIDLIMVPVGGAAAENLAITSLEAGAPVVMANRKIPVRVKLANYSSRSRNARVVISINNERKFEQEVALEAESEKETEIDCQFAQVGMNSLMASIQADALPFDNERHLAVRVFEPCRVLLISPENLPGQPPNREDLFLRFALNPLNKGKENNFSAESRSAVEAENLDLKQFAAVCLVNQRKLSPGLIEKLSAYLLQGGNLITFLGDRVDPDYYNKHLIDKLGGSYLLPARIFKRVGNAVSKAVAYQMTDLDLGHPAFRIFARDGNGDPGRSHIYEFFQVRPNPDALLLTRMSHGLPGMVEEKRGQGRSLLITFPADTSWSDWPLKPTWLPFLHQALIAMVTSQEIQIGNLRPGMPVSATIAAENSEKISIILPDKKEIAVNTSETSGGLIHFTSRETNQTGFYQLRSGERLITAFAVNTAPEESRLKRINLRSVPRFISLKTEPGQGKGVKEKVTLLRDGYDLSRMALWLLLATMLAECWFSNRKSINRSEG